MLRGRLALASVYLCFVCLLAQRSKPARHCSQDMFTNIETVLSQTSDLESLNCSLYTPTTDDYKQNCSSAVMKCFAEEIKVLIEEWQIVVPNDETSSRPFQSLKKLNYGLKILTRSLNQRAEVGCTQCELFGEKKADIFLGELLSTLQMMCTERPSPPP